MTVPSRISPSIEPLLPPWPGKPVRPLYHALRFNSITECVSKQNVNVTYTCAVNLLDQQEVFDFIKVCGTTTASCWLPNSWSVELGSEDDHLESLQNLFPIRSSSYVSVICEITTASSEVFSLRMNTDARRQQASAE